MSFGLYALGYLIVIIAVCYIAHLMHVPQAWIFGIGLLLAGLGIVTGVQTTRQKDPS
jgi:protein-S-isoprenylcysteine O-methyltransferase Ste14